LTDGNLVSVIKTYQRRYKMVPLFSTQYSKGNTDSFKILKQQMAKIPSLRSLWKNDYVKFK